MHVAARGGVSGVLFCYSPPMIVRQVLALKLGLLFCPLDWKPASPSHPPLSASTLLRAGLQACAGYLACDMGAGL